MHRWPPASQRATKIMNFILTLLNPKVEAGDLPAPLMAELA
jgi:hypothetical protein